MYTLFTIITLLFLTYIALRFANHKIHKANNVTQHFVVGYESRLDAHRKMPAFIAAKSS